MLSFESEERNHAYLYCEKLNSEAKWMYFFKNKRYALLFFESQTDGKQPLKVFVLWLSNNFNFSQAEEDGRFQSLEDSVFESRRAEYIIEDEVDLRDEENSDVSEELLRDDRNIHFYSHSAELAVLTDEEQREQTDEEQEEKKPKGEVYKEHSEDEIQDVEERQPDEEEEKERNENDGGENYLEDNPEEENYLDNKGENYLGNEEENYLDNEREKYLENEGENYLYNEGENYEENEEKKHNECNENYTEDERENYKEDETENCTDEQINATKADNDTEPPSRQPKNTVTFSKSETERRIKEFINESLTEEMPFDASKYMDTSGLYMRGSK